MLFFLFYLCIFNDALIQLSFFYFRSVADFSLGLVVDGIYPGSIVLSRLEYAMNKRDS